MYLAILDFLPYIIALVVLLFLYRNLPSLNLEGLLRRFRSPDHLARQQRRRGNFLEAGRLFEELEMPDEAIAAYLEGELFLGAAVVLEGQRKFDRSAQLYLQAGDRKKAAEVYERAGKPGKASVLHLEDGNKLEAGRLFGEAGDWGKAAELYLDSGYPLKAAEAFAKRGETLKAAQAYEAHFMENVAYSTTYSGGGAPASELRNARLAGDLFLAAGERVRARDLYVRGGFYQQAAEVCLDLGDYAAAGEHYRRADQLEASANAHERAGDPVKAANLRGDVALKDNRIPEAAALFVQGKDYLRAAELFESIEMFAEAARAFEAGNSFAAAAGVYLRAGMKAQAAAAFEQGGAYEDAAKLYEQVGDGAKAVELFERAGMTFNSGIAAADAGDIQQAIQLLQRVPPEDESYRAATERLGELFLEVGRPGLAIERLRKELVGESVSRANLELHYWLGRAYERKPDLESAVTLYKKILAEDVSFRDVNDRVNNLGAGTAAGVEGSTAVASSSALSGTADSIRAGDTLGKYQVIRPLGQGAMGRVFLARDTVLERDVALKLMAVANRPDMRQRFEREARAVARMAHPNIVTVYDLGNSTDGQAYIAMELLRGSDLQHAMRHSIAIRTQLEQKLAVILQVLNGLEHAHATGVVHRDIKPANVFIGKDGSVKIMDFGVARLSTASLTGTGSVIGTADYMSPEQVKGAKVSGASDLFSVGAMLYELLAGRPPFRAGSLMATFYAITHSQPKFSSIAKDSAYAPLLPILEKALTKDVACRYQTAREFSGALKAFLRDRSAATGRTLEQLVDLSGTLDGMPEPPVLGEFPAREATQDSTHVPAPAPPPAIATRPPSATPPAARPAPPPGAPPRAPSTAGGQTVPPRSSRFERGEEIGRGVLGVVYRVQDKTNGKVLAMRVLPARDTATESAYGNLLKDLKAAGRIAHPNVARILGLDYPNGETGVLTELVAGNNLEQLLGSGQRPATGQVLDIGRVMAAALGVAHSKGVVHGSLRPSNVMLTERGTKITDFGLGRFYAAMDPPSRYRALEKSYDLASDIFSFGAVLFFLLTGEAPPPPRGVSAPRPTQLGAELPDALDQIVEKCLSPDPATRPSGADDILAQLDAIELP
jgi:serine/threonine protein kinase